MITSELFITNFLFAFTVAITAFTYSYILTKPSEVFAWLYKSLNILFKNTERYQRGDDMHPVFKLLIGCEKCVAGQLALWLFIIVCRHTYLQDIISHMIIHILFIHTTIFLTTLIKSIYVKYIEIRG